MLPVKIGAMLGAAIPAGLGTFDIIRDRLQAEIPNTHACGMPLLGAWMLVLFGTPIGAVVGAAIEVICSLICEMLRTSHE